MNSEVLASVDAGRHAPFQWQRVALADVVEPSDVAPLDDAHVRELLKSFELLGGRTQLQPIILSSGLELIDGAHRLAAARRAGWTSVIALVLDDAAPNDRLLLECESGRVRRRLSVVDFEAVWRGYYEPTLRAEAKQRQLAGLRKHRMEAGEHETESARRPRPQTTLVIGNSNNQSVSEAPRESINKAAKRITGYSLETLNKVAQIRELAADERAPGVLRTAAEQCLQNLRRSGASVQGAYRSLLELRDGIEHGNSSVVRFPIARDVEALERALSEVSRLAERLDGGLAHQLEAAARRGGAERDMLRAARIATANCLAVLVAVECELDPEPLRALRVLGTEVGRSLSRRSTEHIRGYEHAA
ncbi:MAG: ParB N-terminal domain-containing protein [Actinobacteria bacterium]|nr:ParB N-terminal domain-containing protein [Actinomycetota bacterium]